MNNNWEYEPIVWQMMAIKKLSDSSVCAFLVRNGLGQLRKCPRMCVIRPNPS